LELAKIENGAFIEAGKVYLPDADLILGVADSRFEVSPAEQAPGERGTIDSFLSSLAQSEAAHVVAVLLDGTGGDGTLGVTAIKEAGGLAIAEATEARQGSNLAASSSPAAIADILLPVPEIADRLGALAKQLVGTGRISMQDDAEITPALASIAAVLRNR